MQYQQIVTLEERSFNFFGISHTTRTITIREEPPPVQLLIGNTPTKSIEHSSNILSNVNTATNIVKTLNGL